MVKWCGIEKLKKSGKYRIIVPMLPDFINDDFMVQENVSGKILTRLFTDIEEAKTACREFNMLHEKYN